MKKYTYGGLLALTVMVAFRLVMQYVQAGRESIEEPEAARQDQPIEEEGLMIEDEELQPKEEEAPRVMQVEIFPETVPEEGESKEVIVMEGDALYAAQDEAPPERRYHVSQLKTQIFANDEEMVGEVAPVDIDALQDSIMEGSLALPEDAVFLSYDVGTGNICYVSAGTEFVLIWSEEGYKISGEENT